MKSQEENTTMQEWYREAIIEMVKELKNHEYIDMIYGFVKRLYEIEKAEE